tara:strand:- start:197 stop:805 length:609 start_codon:yes stop_codon:yes gene_type:complete
MARHFDALKERDMLPRMGAVRNAASDSSAKAETPLEVFLRTRRLSYLYGTIKTHKMPFGWRFIAGGADISVGPISDWLHRACSALVPDVDAMMREAVVDLPGGTECLLDVSVKHDRGGFYTDLYDKRDALVEQGKMAAVLKFPHSTSALSKQCKYGCLVSFLYASSAWLLAFDYSSNTRSNESSSWPVVIRRYNIRNQRIRN